MAHIAAADPRAHPSVRGRADVADFFFAAELALNETSELIPRR